MNRSPVLHRDFEHQYTSTITLRFNHLPDAEIATHDLMAQVIPGLVAVDGVEFRKVPQR